MTVHLRGGRCHRRVIPIVAAIAATAALATPAGAAQPAGYPPDGRPAWWSYDREPTATPVARPVEVPTRDGTLLACDLSLPGDGAEAGPGPFPGVVVEFTPYSGLRGLFATEASYLAGRGYAAIVCTVRGTGQSGGTWTGANTALETEDNYDLVEWMAAQPWSNGRVGQIGHSYGGFTAYRVAALQPPHLVAIAPMQSQANLYADVIYPGGIKTTPRGSIDDWPPLANALSGGRIDAEAEYAANAAHPLYDDYWKQIAVSTRYDRITVPVLTFGGYDDRYFRAATFANQLGVGDNSWAIYGPWRHAQVIDWPGCGAVPGLCNEQERLPAGVILAWLDHWLAGLPGAPLPSARVTSYEGPVGVGAGWREVRTWRPRYVRAALDTDGGLAASPGWPGSRAFAEPSEPDVPGGSVSFTSPALPTDRVLTGPSLVHLEATLDGTDANFYVELVDVAPDGAEVVVNDGFLKASHRQSDEYLTPAVPGVRTGYDIFVRPDHHRFVAGHRVRLRLSGGRANALVPIAVPTTVTVHTGAGGSVAWLPDDGIS
jgi:predicted acyl esterase